MSTALSTLSNSLANRLGMGESGKEVVETLKATAFKGSAQVTDAQMSALMIVANQYGLNPFTRELYAFPDKGGIVPVVSVDGWSRIINENPQFDGIDFEQDDQSCTCIIHRKDRTHPTKVTEWMAECRRPNAGPWQSHPRRMLRHKAMIQCARLAFGFGGIFDQDEAERITEENPKERFMGNAEPVTREDTRPICTDEKFDDMCVDIIDGETGDITKMGWKSLVKSGTKTADQLIKFLSSKYRLTDEQVETIKSWEEI